MKLEQRTSQPSLTNKYYIITSKGGYNRCLNIKDGYVLPNCVGYAYGRFMEANKITSCQLPTCNAESWIYKNTYYEEGNTPKVGSVIVWAKGKIGNAEDGAGHVGFVEAVNADGSIVVTQSAYKGTAWYVQTLKKPYSKVGYTLVGFIYSPNNFEEGYKGTFPTLPSRGYFKKGDKGTQVKNLQKLLNWANNDKLSVDGVIGDKTIASVKKFQKVLGVSQDGLFGKNTLKKAKEYTK